MLFVDIGTIFNVGAKCWKLYLRQENYLSSIYCKACKGTARIFNCWYLFDNKQFDHRIAIIGECRKCGERVVLLREQRKEDGKTFDDLQVGKKAEHIISLIMNQINYTYDDIKEKDRVPFGWKYGKAIKLKNGYRILRSDFKGMTEVIGYIHKTGHNIISEEEYERLNSKINSN